jgi:formamidopyrimidine-DNA glycosylase
LSTDQGELRLHDPRRFGAVIFSSSLDDPLPAKLLGGLGVEPLVPFENPALLLSSLRLRKSAIKQVLLAGDWIVGVGNIYASEALFHAGIRPTTSANRLSRVRAMRLMESIRMVLQRAVELGGSTLQDFVHTDGHSGQFQEHTMVYGRDALPCRICDTRIKRVIQGQRSSYYCPKCQKS